MFDFFFTVVLLQIDAEVALDHVWAGLVEEQSLRRLPQSQHSSLTLKQLFLNTVIDSKIFNIKTKESTNF